MKTIFLLFLCFFLAAATPTAVFIDSGSPAELNCSSIPAGSAPCYTGGYAYTVQPAADTTLRYGWAPAGQPVPPFSYTIPTGAPGAYQVDLNFLEPSPSPPARAFSVTINDQLVYPRLTLQYLVPLTRSAIIATPDGVINLRFDTLTRGAVVSSIRVTPFAVTQYIQPSDPKTARVTGAVPVWMQDAYYVPRPAIETDPTVLLLYQNVEVFRNGVRQLESNQSAAGADFTVLAAIGQLKVAPVTGQPWPSTDAVVVNYTAVWPPALEPLALRIIRQDCARCHGGDLKPGDTHLVNGLDLRHVAYMVAGGNRGPALVPGDRNGSRIYTFMKRPQFPTATPAETLALTTSDEETLGMPPFGRSPEWKIQVVGDWIDAGAPGDVLIKRY
jgi:hypothetical protein